MLASICVHNAAGHLQIRPEKCSDSTIICKDCQFIATRIVVISNDCNHRIEFSIPGSGIEKFVIPGSRFGIRLTDKSSFWYSQ